MSDLNAATIVPADMTMHNKDTENQNRNQNLTILTKIILECTEQDHLYAIFNIISYSI